MKFIEEIEEKFNSLQTEEEIEEANVTGNIDGGEGPPKTPHAFKGSGDEPEGDHIEVFDYKKSKKTQVHTESANRIEERMYKKIHEISYKEYKNDDSMSPRKKINVAIKEMNRTLYEMERMVKQNAKLKNEMGVDGSKYWKSTQYRLGKMTERILKVAYTLKELGA